MCIYVIRERERERDKGPELWLVWVLEEAVLYKLPSPIDKKQKLIYIYKYIYQER